MLTLTMNKKEEKSVTEEEKLWEEIFLLKEEIKVLKRALEMANEDTPSRIWDEF